MLRCPTFLKGTEMEVLLLIAGILFALFGFSFVKDIQAMDKNTKSINEHPEFYCEAKRTDFEALEPMHYAWDGKLYRYVGERYVSPEAQAIINHENKRLA